MANRGELQNVSVFDADGNYLRSIGKSSGCPLVGAYDASGMLQAGGVALDAKGRLWVAETLDGPKRVSMWDTVSGENLDEFFDASAYFSYGVIDPERAAEIYAHDVLWDIDWEAYTTRPRSTVWRKRHPNMAPLPVASAYQGIPRLVTTADGAQYMWGNTRGASILLRREGDIFNPFAALFDLAHQTGIAVIDEDRETWPRDRRSPQTLLWQDANSDQIVQADELILLPEDYNRARFAWLHEDLRVRLSKGRIWQPDSVLANGQPMYDFTQAEAAVSGREGYMVPLADGSVIHQLTRRAADGTVLWRYPGLIPWRDSLNRPILGPGRLWAMTGLMGLAGDFITHQTYFGVNQIFRVDSQYVGAILNDRRVEGRGPYAGQSEGQGGGFVKLEIAGRERTFAIGGSNGVRVWEVHGLDTIENLPGGVYHHTEEAASQARSAMEAYAAALAGERRLHIVSGGKEALATAPTASRRVEGGRGFDVRAAYDDEGLYIRFDVSTPHRLINAIPDSRIVFRGSNLLDIQLATDPDADPERTAPAPGDMRFLVGRQGRRSFAVRFRPRIAGFDGERDVLHSPTGQEAFDAIDVVDTVALEHAGTDAGFTATVTLPHALTGLQPVVGEGLKLDLGYVFGNEKGTRSTIRAYLFNDSFSANVVDDIPHESRLEPQHWGAVIVELADHDETFATKRVDV